MALLHGRDLLSGKYVTAIIIDASKRIHFVPIKNPIDEYFLAEINKQVYMFKIGEICQYREKLTKQFQVIFYDTSHYMPINSKVKELELFLIEHGFGRVNGMFSDVLRILGARERTDKKEAFKPHKLDDLVKMLQDYKKTGLSQVLPETENTFNKQVQSIVNFLNQLDIKEIVTPVRSISEFIEDDLKATDPKFPAAVVQTLQTLDHENKKVTNVPMPAARAWLLPMLIIMMITVIAFFIYWAYENGMFDSILSLGDSFGDLGASIKGIDPNLMANKSDPCSDVALQKKYPQPVDLKIALENGSETCKLSPFMKGIVDKIEAPRAVPKP